MGRLMGRRGAMLGGVGLSALLLSGCSATQGPVGSGEAAVSEAFTISQAQVADDVAAVLAAMGRPPAEPSAEMTLANVQRMVQSEVIEGAAASLGVSVSTAAVQQAVAQLAEQSGGVDALSQLAVQAYIPPEAIEDVVRTNLLAEAIGAAVVGGDESGDPQLGAQQAIVGYSQSIDVEVAPRYGTWDDTTLTIAPGSTVAQDAAPAVAP